MITYQTHLLILSSHLLEVSSQIVNMVLSKLPSPILLMFSKYLQEVYLNPIRTKSLTSCVFAALGNYTSQALSGARINQKSIVAFGLFGLLFGGTIPHYFYKTLDTMFSGRSTGTSLVQFIIERFLFAPLYQFFALYTLARFEGKSHENAFQLVIKLYWPVLQANWKCLSMIQLFNFTLVPPMLRVLVVNMIGFFWSIYISIQRRAAEQKSSKDKSLDS